MVRPKKTVAIEVSLKKQTFSFLPEKLKGTQKAQKPFKTTHRKPSIQKGMTNICISVR